MQNPVLGIAAIERRLAIAGATTAKHAIERVNRFLGNIKVGGACGDLITAVVGESWEGFLAVDCTDPKTKHGQFQTLSVNPYFAPS